MKKIFKYLMVATLSLAFAGCSQDAIDDLTGIYAAPEAYTMTSAAEMGVEKQGNVRIFNVAFTDQNNNTLNMKMAGDSYFLQAAAFTPAEAAKLRKGNYAIGESTFSRNGGSAVGIVKGVLTTTKNDDKYTINGTLWLNDGSVIKVNGGGVLVYEPDPEALKLTQVLSVSNNVPNGTNSVTLNLGTDGVTATPNAWGGVDMGGSGNYLAVDFYSTDGTLAPGVYAPADANAMTELTYGMGWDPGDLWGIGMIFENWGTCWWTVDGGVTSAQHIEEGNIEVKKSGSVYTITYEYGGLFFEFVGEIPGLAETGQQSYDTTLTQVLSATNNVANGSCSVTINLGTEGLSTAPNAWGGVDITGTGQYLAVDFYSADGTLAAGKYTPADTDPIGPFTYQKGWDPGDLWGIGMIFENWGTCWWTVEDGVASAQHIEEGEITVEFADGIFTISYAHGGISFQYVGEIEGIPGVANGNDNPPAAEYIEISNFLSAAVNNGTTLSLQLATDGISTVPNAWGGVDLAGDGNYLKIDLYTTDGTLAEGTYTPADNDQLGEGNFAKGYDPGDVFGWGIDFKNWGTAWMTREGDNETGVNIEDGTITVEKSGSDYIITLTSTAANIRYTGPITL